MKSLFSTKVLAIIARLAGGGVQILAVFAISRLLGLEYVGAYSLALSFAILMGGALSLGLPNYLIYVNSVQYSQGQIKEFSRLFFRAGKIIIIFGIVLKLLMLWGVMIFSDTILASYDSLLILSWSPLMGVFFALVTLVVMNLRAMERFLSANLLDRPMIGLITVVGFIGIISAFGADADKAASLAMIVGGGLVAAIGFWFIVRILRILDPQNSTIPSPPIRWRLVSHYFTALIVEVILARATLVVASFVYTTSVLGSFQVAYTLAIGLIIFQEALGGIYGPKFAILYNEGKLHELRRLNLNAIYILAFATTVYTIPFLLFPEYLVGLMSPELGREPRVFYIILAAVAIRLICGLYRSMFEATGQIRNSIWISLLAVFTLFVGLYGFQELGSIGLAAAWALATVLHSILGLCVCLYIFRDR